MNIKIRLTHAFAELKVDMIEDTIHKSDPKEISQTVENLLDVANDLLSLIGKEIKYKISEK